MNKMNYRIALQSKEMLTNALLKLMETDDYSQITVIQLCQEADLSRRTFYRLYETKEDVLHEYMGSLIEHFKGMVSEAAPEHYTEIAAIYFNFWKHHSNFLKLLRRNNLLGMLYQTAGEVAPSVFQIANPDNHTDYSVLAFALSYSLGGLNGMLIRWAEDGMKISPDELTSVLKQTLNIATR